jgi:hypothetical protein
MYPVWGASTIAARDGERCNMTTREETYLAMVIAAAVLFGVTLAWVSMFRK